MDCRNLRAEMVRNGISKKQVEDVVGLSAPSMYRRFQGVLFECSECGAKTVDAVGNYTQEYCAACGRKVVQE